MSWAVRPMTFFIMDIILQNCVNIGNRMLFILFIKKINREHVRRIRCKGE